MLAISARLCLQLLLAFIRTPNFGCHSGSHAYREEGGLQQKSMSNANVDQSRSLPPFRYVIWCQLPQMHSQSST
eukprot:6181200-Pleurochrysis_carterae.AAC.1